MQIDYPTLLVTAAGTCLVLGLLCFVMAQSETPLRPLRLCGFGHLCFALGMPMLLLRGGPYAAFGIVLGNSIGLFGWGLQVVAVRRCAGRPPWAWLPPAAAGTWMLACLVPAFMASFPTRAFLGGGLAGLLAGLAAWELARSWTGWRPLRPIILLLCGLHPLAQLLRMAAAALHGAEGVAALNPAMVLSGLAAIFACTVVLVPEALRRAERQAGARLAAAHADTAASRRLAVAADREPAGGGLHEPHPAGFPLDPDLPRQQHRKGHRLAARFARCR
ncbi:hypothetical protein [Dankookia sp. P2]|uniref:hypothetical protein n=1 Tax=Dankookia sp. P2 TaxID=3423955 RepID=UPI003D6714F4